jgi:hypothetical protein
MPKRSSTRPKEDANQAAFRAVRELTRDPGEPAPSPPPKKPAKKKNPAAVALGKLGGRKGGKARAERLTPEQRSEIARKAAQTRWSEKKGRSEEPPVVAYPLAVALSVSAFLSAARMSNG